jgi:biotin-dependent carboxylase-like uncharacterized protein
MALRVTKPGLLTTVQDLGRWGFQSSGVPVAGPMDMYSHRLANALVGNDAGAALLEVTMVGPEITFDDERVVAVTGARIEVTLDGSVQAWDCPFVAAAGSHLRFGPRSSGARAYLAVEGGIATRPVLGSRATHVASATGGLEGRALRAGDRLPLGAAVSRGRRIERRRPAGAAALSRLPVAGHTTVRVLPGPHADHFASGALDMLQAERYEVAPDSNRQGFRLNGAALGHARGANIISEALSIGAIQVPASGRPILLMADRQTTGGYPSIATVISADLGLAGQLGPGDTITFKLCTPRDALSALIVQEQTLMAVAR